MSNMEWARHLCAAGLCRRHVGTTGEGGGAASRPNDSSHKGAVGRPPFGRGFCAEGREGRCDWRNACGWVLESLMGRMSAYKPVCGWLHTLTSIYTYTL